MSSVPVAFAAGVVGIFRDKTKWPAIVITILSGIVVVPVAFKIIVRVLC